MVMMSFRTKSITIQVDKSTVPLRVERLQKELNGKIRIEASENKVRVESINDSLSNYKVYEKVIEILTEA